MKKIALQYIATLLVGLSTIGSATAASVAGALKAPAGAIDGYQTICSKDTSKFVAHVKAAKGTPMISVQVYKTGNKLVANATDAKNGDTVFSPDAVIKGGNNGAYIVMVDKSAAGAINYTVEMTCKNSAGKPSGQDKPVMIENE